MTPELEASYKACQQIARRTAKNFYYSFLSLPKPQRKSMCALYAFLRLTDDLGDSESPVAERKQQITLWRESLRDALAGMYTHEVFPALHHTIETYHIPHEYLYAVLDGMEMDLEETQYKTFADLELYCYRVASVVGLCCIHIWGFDSADALEPARKLGIAFQLTNILRDIHEDRLAGRIYLPEEDLAQFHYTQDDLKQQVDDDRFRDLMGFEIQRAKQLYRSGIALAEYVSPIGLPCLEVMTRIYSGLLQEIEKHCGSVFHKRIRLSRWRKGYIALQALLRRPDPKRLSTAVGFGC